MKTYLGDSVYADFDGFHIVLTTENGDFPSNTIALETEVLAALDNYRKAMRPPVIPTSDLPETLASSLESALNYQKAGVDRIERGIAALGTIREKLTDKMDLNPYGGEFWFDVKNREDLQVLMSLAPRWEKSASDSGIAYSATVNGVAFRLHASSGALPPTCRLVEREVEVPAVAAHTVKKMVVECQPVAETVEV